VWRSCRAELLQAVRSGNQDFPKTYFKELYQLIYYINSLDKPFLPIMNGITSTSRRLRLPFGSVESCVCGRMWARAKIPWRALCTVGSGASLGYSSSSFRVTTEQAIFALPEVGMGFFPDSGATYFLPRLADHVGTFLALTGKRIRGWDVLYVLSLSSSHPIPR
jgi:enoyl-CoA hydratase/carnithine racemase